MQKKLIALAVAGLASTAAFAQSNVTIYGVADVGVESGNYGDGSKFRVQSGQSAGSRIGFKGVEDLGNGLSALFTLEMGVAFDNGATTTHSVPGFSAGNQGGSSAGFSYNSLNGSTNDNSGSIFQRQAFAGLKSNTLGQVTFGRQYAPGFYVKSQADAFGLGLAGTANNVWSKLAAFGVDRLENEIQYMTPTFAGFTAAVGYSSGAEVGNGGVVVGNATAAQVSNNSKKAGETWGALALYNNGPLKAGVAYHKVTGLTGGQDNAFNGAALVAAAADQNAKINGWIAGGSYDFGVAALYAGYATSKSERDNTNSATNGNRLADGTVWNVGVKVPFGKHSVMAQYSKFNDKLAADADFKVVGLGYNYDLSKRTALYAGWARGVNKNLGASTLHTATNTGMAITDNSATALSGRGFDPSVINVGVRHSF